MSLFNSGEFGEMRTCCDPGTGEVWFNLNDVCRALDLTNPRMVKSRLDDDVSQTYPLDINSVTLSFWESFTLKHNPSNLHLFLVLPRSAQCRVLHLQIDHRRSNQVNQITHSDSAAQYVRLQPVLSLVQCKKNRKFLNDILLDL